MLRDAWVDAGRFPKFARGTRFPLRCRLRKFLGSQYPMSCYVQSEHGAWHFLSADPIDDLVLRGMLGSHANLYFPVASDSLIHTLRKGGLVLDIGAFNGFWTAEMLARHPGARGLLLEPNLSKCRNISKTIRASGLTSRTQTIPAALGKADGRGWLIKSEEGSWGDWVQSNLTVKSNEGREISTITLARALAGNQPVVVKCNAEGGEYELIQQILILGLRPKLMILFVHPEHGDANKLWSDLRAAGYAPDVIEDSSDRPCWHVRLI
jgi:FkbM family methyltransferase